MTNPVKVMTMMKMGINMACERCKVIFARKSGNQRYCRDCNVIKDREWLAERRKNKKVVSESARNQDS